jgi:predicted RNase H-like HicB family nuclease
LSLRCKEGGRNEGTDDVLVASIYMELAIRIHVEQLPEGLFLATSDELPGLVAQGRTVAETLDIARDVARKLIEARRERDDLPDLPAVTDRRDYTIVVAA